ncbi:MAG: Cof-type HAD-IIB family hydrolase [Firmicutes bacterium]|nr:Cof-type HAD-IIB family hydrolase [Bacillota bacterium]
MTYKIVFFDVDGTLLNTKKELPASTIEAIRTLRKGGVIGAIASARTPFNIHMWLDALHIDTYIVYNGGLIVHDGRVLHQETIDEASAASLVKRVRTNGHSIMPEGARHFSLVSHEPERIIETYAKAWDHDKRVAYEDLHEPISQMDLFCTDDEIAPYGTAFPNLTFYPWMSRPNAFNVIPKGVSKAYGIELILAKLGIAKADSVAFGDGPNDLEMLAYVGLGVAMGNAVDELKAQSGYVTSHVDEDGIANGLRHLGLI